MAKERLDILLVEKGLESSRERAKAIIMSGIVYVNNQKADKPGQLCGPDDAIEVRGSTLKYVSRGGLKIEKALGYFAIDPKGWVAMDVGASTGGFTHCLLMNGAKRVYAVDVGYGQLAWELRTDERVVCMERTNIRHVTPEQIGEPLDFAVIDVSFISLKLVLPAVKALLKPTGQIATLIKPQFEAGRDKVGKKGVVREKSTHMEVLEKIVDLAQGLGFTVVNLTYSPIKGPEGNIEFLAHLSLDSTAQPGAFSIEEIVDEVHSGGKAHE